MGFYVVVLLACAGIFVASWRRSDRSMTRYVMFTGAPIVWVLLGASALVAALSVLFGNDEELGRGVFTGGLIGTALVQVVLLRRVDASKRRGLDDAADR